jgi:hypothetical protein
MKPVHPNACDSGTPCQKAVPKPYSYPVISATIFQLTRQIDPPTLAPTYHASQFISVITDTYPLPSITRLAGPCLRLQ